MNRYLSILAAVFFGLITSEAYAANAYVTEFSSLGSTYGGVPPQIGALPPVTHQKVDFSAGAASAAAFNAQTFFVRVHCDAACSIRVGGTATTSYLRIPTDGVEYFGVHPGDVLSVIANP